ncbi:hypothetical protein [Rickettsia bellii]|uniref:Ankyrin repeat protein n=1 Tax=Rickettsia bellii str. RML An4 TaxID=1359193 RepID=A0A0F3QBC0_RICBE|nr:hypothetical protein [Rickettsia bellii]KJV89843.1 hypothetical protein RBEAN4_0832 [Rickettsia bellii str. RML An4]
MNKVIMYGPGITDIPNTTHLASIRSSAIDQYLNNLNTPVELFIRAHGLEYFQENLPSQLSLNLFRPDNDFDSSERLAHNVLTEIAKNTIGNTPNIVHIFSCHSGAAQHNLKDVEGNIVLCTYTKPENELNNRTSRLVFNRKETLIDFIVENLPLLIATDFTISYKLDDNIHTLMFDHTSIKKMDLVTFSEFLQIQYKNVVKFYTELQQQYSNKYQELIPEYDFPKIISYLPEKLKSAFNIVLNEHYHSLTKSEMKHLLKIDNSYISIILDKAIKEFDLNTVELILDSIEINNLHILSAISASNTLPSNQSIQIFEMVYAKIKNADYNILLLFAINAENLSVAEFLLDKIQIQTFHLISAIQKANPNIVKILLNKVENIDNLVLNEANKLGSPLIFKLVLNKMVENNSLVLADIIKTATPYFIKLALDKMKKVNQEDLVEAIKLGDQNILKLILNKIENPHTEIFTNDRGIIKQMEEVINSPFSDNAIFL